MCCNSHLPIPLLGNKPKWATGTWDRWEQRRKWVTPEAVQEGPVQANQQHRLLGLTRLRQPNWVCCSPHRPLRDQALHSKATEANLGWPLEKLGTTAKVIGAFFPKDGSGHKIRAGSDWGLCNPSEGLGHFIRKGIIFHGRYLDP